MLAGQAVHILLHRNTLVGQQCGKGILFVLVILDKAGGQLVLQIPIFLGVHQIHSSGGSVFQAELSFPDLMGFVNLLPFGIKCKGIDKIHDRILGDLVKDLRDHAVRVFLDPVIDIVTGGFVKGCLVGICSVIVCIGLKEALLHLESGIILEPDRVCQTQLVAL